PRRLQEVTAGGARLLFQAAREARVERVVLTSSVAALGVPVPAGAPGSLLMNETHTWNYPPRRWLYGYAKYRAELEAQEAIARGLEVVIVNPSVVVGAGDLNRVSGEALLRVARRRLPVTVQGGLNAVHIQDVVDGHLAAWERGRAGERYVLGGENMTHRQFLSLAAEVAGVPLPWLHLPAWLVRMLVVPAAIAGRVVSLPIGADAFHRAGMYFYYDCSKARRELGLSPPRSIRQAISESLNWYRQRGLLAA
ncbi:MAG: NAD-dependent epimerase/dehydratase family protein, partial [Anaerolineales bacterium]|nr:NAD-dependent epimerase/dehydratase family protein [Anaerolineales bacterium]